MSRKVNDHDGQRYYSVYRIKCLATGLLYFGSTCQSSKIRLSENKNRGYSPNVKNKTALQIAVDTYGKWNFSIQDMYFTKCKDQARKVEQQYIDEFDTLNPAVGLNERNAVSKKKLK